MSSYVRHPEDMNEAGADARTLGEWLEERKDELRMSWAEVGERAGISRQTLLDIRNGATSPRSHTKRNLEHAVQWEPRSIDAIQRGGEPTRLPGSLTARPKEPAPVNHRLAEIIAASVEQLDEWERLFGKWNPTQAREWRAWANGVRAGHSGGSDILPQDHTESEAG